jgi:hypothetical protein
VLEKTNSPNSKVEYNNNHSLDLLQILNLSLGDQTKMKFGLKYEMKMTSEGPLMEDDLKILKVEYLINHWSDLPQTSNLSLGDPTKVTFGLKSEMKTTSNGPPIGRRPQNIKS